jgi:hypothetical protein
MGVVSYLSLNQLQSVLYELKQEHSNLNKIGEITKEGRWSYFVNGLFQRDQPRWVALIEKVNQTFARLEEKGIKIFDPHIEDQSVVEKFERYKASRLIYLNVAEAIGSRIQSLQNICPKLKQAYHELECRERGLRYSLGTMNGGLDALPGPDQAWLGQLTALAASWKERQELAISQALNELEILQLKQLACYPDWLQVVVKNPEYLSEVFNWCLRDFNQVEVIVKCYETRRKLKAALLSANLGYVRNIFLKQPEEEVLAFQTVATKVQHISKRILTFSIYHGHFKNFRADQKERVNILKPHQSIHFKQGNYYLTVEELLKEMSQKNQREVNISLCSEGLINFHPVLGVWNADLQQHEMPSMTAKDWPDHVPGSNIVSHAELIEQYGERVNQRDFFFKNMATRQHLDLNALDCHAFWQLYVRMDDGNWKVLNIGSYAYRFQKGLLDGLWLFCATVVRVICLFDQAYYTHRQRGAYPDLLSEDEEKRRREKECLLAKIFSLMQSKGVFQFSGRNCAYYVQKVAKKVVENLPNLFHVPLTICKTGIGPLDRVLEWSEKQWVWISWLIVTILHTAFLSHRSIRITTDKGEVYYSVREYFNKKGYKIYNPSYLPYQIAQAQRTKDKDPENPFVKGELYWSHTDEKIYQLKALKMMPTDQRGGGEAGTSFYA